MAFFQRFWIIEAETRHYHLQGPHSACVLEAEIIFFELSNIEISTFL